VLRYSRGPADLRPNRRNQAHRTPSRTSLGRHIDDDPDRADCARRSGVLSHKRVVGQRLRPAEAGFPSHPEGQSGPDAEPWSGGPTRLVRGNGNGASQRVGSRAIGSEIVFIPWRFCTKITSWRPPCGGACAATQAGQLRY